MGEQNNFTRRMFIKGVATSFGALPVFAWPRWAQAFYYNLGFFKKGSAASTYIEDVFSTYLYTGNGGTQSITNGINLASKGGLVWMKSRSNAYIHELYDTARGVNMHFHTDETGPSVSTAPNGVTSFNSDGFTTGGYAYHNGSGVTFSSWTFRKAEKFFDEVTYTGDGSGMKTINHSLGVTPGMVIIKRTDAASDWVVWHRSLTLTGNTQGLKLNATDAFGTPAGGGAVWYTTSPMTSTTISVGSSQAGDWNTNLSGASYIAYLFAHDTATDGLIQCGSYTGSGGVDSVTLGWEPQFVLMKSTSVTGQWSIEDVMRDMNHSGQKQLQPNSSGSEISQAAYVIPNATGFTVNAGYYGTGATVIYMAIRRPMKIPTSGTQVYNAQLWSFNAVGTPPYNASSLSNPDMVIGSPCSAGSIYGKEIIDRLRGGKQKITTTTNSGESTGSYSQFDENGIRFDLSNGGTYVGHLFRRAPGFFDIVCYTGSGGNPNIAHNLGVVPELIIGKKRTAPGYGQDWYVKHKDFATAGTFSLFNSSAAVVDGSIKYSNLTSTKFDASNEAAQSTDTYVAYLFASCPGVSKVGSYTGSASDVTVSCGFSGQPRFVLVKRTDAAGDWIVVDSARGTSVYITLNTTSAETSATVITFTTGGFVAKAATVANAASGATYIFMAIA